MAVRVDLISLIESAYQTHTDETAWLSRLAELMTPLFARGAPVFPYRFALDEERHKADISDLISDDPSYTREKLAEMHALQVGGNMRRAYECAVLCTLGRAVGRGLARAALARSGLPTEDVLGLRANAQARSGAFFCTPVSAHHRISQRDRLIWSRIAAHVGAGLRLRQRLAAAGAPPPESAAAILTPGGALEHGRDDAVAARGELGAAAREVDRARGRMRRLDPERATEVWRAMVRGDWTLVDWFDHDGKRFLVAHENRVAAPRPALARAAREELSLREWEVAACAAMGHSNKLIAYDLGLSTASVSMYLRRAERKLGATSRVALVARYRDLCAQEVL